MYTASESETREVLDHVGTGIGGWHELPPCQTPTASDPEPGRFILDDDGELMSIASERDIEEARLVESDPRLTYVKVSFESESVWMSGKRFDAGTRWHVFVSINDFNGSGSHASDPAKAGDAALADLRDRLAAAVAIERARQLDTVAPVSAVAEEKAA